MVFEGACLLDTVFINIDIVASSIRFEEGRLWFCYFEDEVASRSALDGFVRRCDEEAQMGIRIVFGACACVSVKCVIDRDGCLAKAVTLLGNHLLPTHRHFRRLLLCSPSDTTRVHTHTHTDATGCVTWFIVSNHQRHVVSALRPSAFGVTTLLASSHRSFRRCQWQCNGHVASFHTQDCNASTLLISSERRCCFACAFQGRVGL